MGRIRARLLAVAIVVGSMIGSALAIELWPQLPPPESNPSIPVGSNGRVVFSIRNTEASSITVDSFTKPGQAADPGCDNMNLPVPLSGSLPVTIPSGGQAQFVVTLRIPYDTIGDKSCTFNIQLAAPPASTPSVEVVFHVATTEDFDVQPTVMHFGSQIASNFETQALVVTGWGSAQAVTVGIDYDPSSNFEIDGCTTPTCSISLPGSGGSNGVQVRCTAETAGSASGWIVVRANTFGGSGSGSGSAVMVGSAALFCNVGSVGGGVLDVGSTALDFGSIAVGNMGSNTLQLSNRGGASLTGVAITFPNTNGEHYYAGACTATSPCTLAANSSQLVTIWFAPQSHGDKPSQLEVDADQHGAPISVALTGTGLGGVMVVEQPSGTSDPAYHLDLGVIPIDQQQTATITLRNAGNALYNATITGANPPYTVTPTSDAVPESMTRDFAVTCGSNAASASNDQTWTISSTAYLGANQNITVACAIADTRLEVDPLMFQFGEVRVGSETQAKTLTLTNPATNIGPVVIKSMQLRAPRPGLSLAPPTTTNQTLPLGGQLTAVLQLQTGSDSDLEGGFIDIAVDNAMLSLPVHGKVVTPHSRVAPRRLDLGTACVGTQVSGNVMLINDGTATLNVERPVMTESFVASTQGSLFPLRLPPGMSETAEISPAVSAAGALEGELTWVDDVPTVHTIPVVLEYVTTGTALSPRALDFGIVAVDVVGTTQRVVLENCDAEPATIAVKTLRGLRGPIGAWVIEPKVGYTKELASHEKQAVNVTFKPPARGRYEAELIVTTRSGTQTVFLVGEATGRDFEQTSFYTCVCSSPGAPWGGWPLAIAVAIVIVRRRRGSSSAR